MDWLLILLGFVLILGTGFFVCVEFALVALDQAYVQEAIDRGDRGAIPLMKCLKSLSTQLSACQLGITLTTLLTGFVLDSSLGHLFREFFDGMGLASSLSGPLSLTLAMVLATLFSMLLGELAPKNMAISVPFRAGKLVARPQLVFTAIFRPAVVVLNGFSNWVLGWFGLEAKEELSGARSPEELSSLVRRSAQMGTLDADTANFVDRSLRFSERDAADVMTPRMRVQMLPVDAPLQDVIDAARRTGFSRFPLYEDAVDDVVGIVHVKQAIAVPVDRREGLFAGTIKERAEVLRVPESIHLDDLLTALREGNLQLAIVVDEYGGLAGIATLEDLVEEIVGEVADEHDRIAPGVLQSATGEWFFPALLRPDEVSTQITGISIPESSAYETTGGFIMDALGRIPAVGDTVVVEGGTLSVTRMDGRRVDRLRFTPATASVQSAQVSE